jgi:hypothetical protein
MLACNQRKVFNGKLVEWSEVALTTMVIHECQQVYQK